MNARMHIESQPRSATRTWFPPLQRKCASCAHAVDEECDDCASKRIQRKSCLDSRHDGLESEADRIADLVCAPSAGPDATPPAISRMRPESLDDAAPPSSVDAVLASPGSMIEPKLRDRLEQRFGYDFSQVRIHSDADAARSASDVDALAYTVGNAVVFGAAQYAPATPRGQHLLAHELTHVVQQSSLSASGVQRKPLQRQSAEHASTYRPPLSCVPSEKWSDSVEGAYRRAGLVDAANAVRHCRETRDCRHLLTGKEAWDAYRRGRIEARMPPPEPSERREVGQPIAMAGLAAPALAQAGGGSAPATAVRTYASLFEGGVAANTNALLAEGGAAVVEGGAAASSAAAPVAAAPAAAPVAGTAAVSTVAVPIAIGVYFVLATYDLFKWTSFQRELRRLGYIVLPDPLAVCIGNCHQPGAPSGDPKPTPRFEPNTPRPTPLQPLKPQQPWGLPIPTDDDERKRLEDWVRAGPTPTPAPTPKPAAPPVPQPNPERARRRRRRPDAYPICWATQLLPPMLFGLPVAGFVRTPNADRDESFMEQLRLQTLLGRQASDPHFRARDLHIHHSVPLFLGGLDGTPGNLVALPRLSHLRGHAVLRHQPQMLTPPPPLAPLPPDLYAHPAGTRYELVGFKNERNEDCP